MAQYWPSLFNWAKIGPMFKNDLKMVQTLKMAQNWPNVQKWPKKCQITKKAQNCPNLINWPAIGPK
jgi:hypothetical protein